MHVIDCRITISFVISVIIPFYKFVKCFGFQQMVPDPYVIILLTVTAYLYGCKY